MTPEQSEALRKPFPPEAIGKLPKAGISLDYVGHATTTDRLLSVDPEWTWEPLALAEDGGPMIRHGGKELTMWIRLTVCGVTRLGVGSVAANAFDAEKQLVGDALRNAAMRFGVALDLWSKAELESEHVAKNTVTCPRCTFSGERMVVRSHLIKAHDYVPDSTGKVHPPSKPPAPSPPTPLSSEKGAPPPLGAGPSLAAPPTASDTGGGAAAGMGAPPSAAPPPMTTPQRGKLLATLGERGLGAKQARLDWASDTLGRHLDSFSSLTKAEAGTLIEAAEKLPAVGTLEGVS